MNLHFRRYFPCFLVVAAWLSPAAAGAAEAQNVASSVERVTLYRGQAMVARSVTFDGGRGPAEVVVTDLPANVVGDSLFAEGNDEVEIRAVRYRTRAVGEEPREEVRRLDEQMLEVGDKLALNQKTQELLQKRSTYLDNLENFVAPTATTELSKGVLNAEALEKLSEFSFTERQRIATETVAAMKEQRDLQGQLSLLERSKAEISTGAMKEVREAVIFIEQRAENGQQTITLSYLVNNCGWSPTYTVRAIEGGEEVNLEYNALIQQMSGEDWTDVDLTLSTASPALSAAVPGLAPFEVTLNDPSVEQAEAAQQPMFPGDKAQMDAAVAEQFNRAQLQQKMVVLEYGNAVKLADNLDLNWAINSAANDAQCAELLGSEDALRNALSMSTPVGEGPSINYQLEGKVNLASRADQQMVRILQTALQSEFYHVATPVLTSFVFREAEVKNDSEMDLLDGPITVYLDGRFVGRSEIETVARGQSFVVGFGADPQLRVRRELAEKDDKYQGGNRELSFDYRLVIENYKDKEVTVRLFDRLPYSDRDSDVRVTMTSPGLPLSTDPLYLRLERPKGILRWEVQVPSNASGEKAHMVQYAYTLEFDRTKYLASPSGSSVERQQREFEELQRGRLKK